MYPGWVSSLQIRRGLEAKKLKTLLFLNPHARGGRLFSSIYKHKKELERILGNVEFFGSTKDEEVIKLKDDLKNGVYERLISVGGDGTNNYILNNYIIPLNLKIPFGNLPIGTGSDWAKNLSTPKKLHMAAEWIKNARVFNSDLGVIEYMKNGEFCKVYFLNIASFGLSGKVASVVNNWHTRGKTVYLRATLITLFTYLPNYNKITVDGNTFFEGKNYLIAFANGRIFGGGMKIAPEAKINDGFFDVILVKAASFFSFIKGIILVFRGKHLKHPAILYSRGKDFTFSSDKKTYFEIDGEDHLTSFAKIKVQEKALPLLLKEGSPAVI